jgi:hypothetical protein
MNTKKVLLFTVVLVALLTISSPSIITNAELSPLSEDVNTMDSPTFDGKNAIGLAYDAGSSVGGTDTFKYDLEKDREYVVFVYGPFINTNTDYDIELYEPGDSDPSEVTTKAAGKMEQIKFEANEDGEYKVKVVNDKDDSGGNEDAFVFLAEIAKTGSDHRILIEARETIHTYYAFWFDASEKTGDTVTLKLKTHKDVDMYQMRVYPFIGEEESGSEENIYDVLESTSENAILTDDAGQAGEDLEISFTPGDEAESPSNIYIISLIGEKGDGECTFRISTESEEETETTTTEEPTVQPLCMGTLAVSAFSVISLIAVGLKRRKYSKET